MYRAVVRGDVQGVGFRATAKYIADRKGLNGTARNLQDGSVEIVLDGPRAALEQFLRDIEQRLPTGCIQKVEISDYSSSAIRGFSILR